MFLMAPILIGLAAVSIPIIVHLLHRQRTTPVKWGAMQFLLESKLQLKRRKRVDHWLLMLLRIAAVALLVFALSRPLMIEGQYNPLGSGQATDVAVVVDRSLSTGKRAGDASVFEKSVAAVAQLAQGMKPSDTLSVVTAEHRPQVQAVRLAQAKAPGVSAKLKEMGAGSSDASIPEAIQTARELLADGHNPRKMILVVSDEQRANWAIEDNAAWSLAAKNAKVYSLPITPDGKSSDVAVADVSVAPSLIGYNRPAQISATISNSGPDAVSSLSVQLHVDGKLIETRLIPSLPANESRAAQFDYTFKTPGSHWVKIHADTTDALEADNTAILATTVWERLPVLIIDGQLTAAGDMKSSDFLRAAMTDDERPLVQPKVVSVTGSTGEKLDDYAVVVVNDAPRLAGEMLVKLSDYARNGRAVWFILGPRSEKSFVSHDLSEAGLFTLGVKGVHKPDAGQQNIEVKDAQHPTLQLITAAERNALNGAVARSWWNISPQVDGARVILSAQSGDPLVLERSIGSQGGRVMLWTTSVDGTTWNNLPVQPHFVPLVNETLFHLAAGQMRGLDNRRLNAGQEILWIGPPAPQVRRATLLRPDNSTLDLAPRVSSARQTVAYNDTFLPGLYTLRFDQTAIAQPLYYGVGIDPRELDSSALSLADQQWLSTRGYLEKRLNGLDDLASAVGAVNKGNEIWPYLAGALLATLVLETFMTWRMIRHQAAPPVAIA